MEPKSFYEVETNKYFFGRNDAPEEKVRQWVISELLSTYGFRINNIAIEVPVKVGTRTHRADIVVYQEGSPHIVIECKQQDVISIQDGLTQALSYADSHRLRAKFAICTNGNDWLVRRKVNDLWEVVPDIGKRTFSIPIMGLSSFLSLTDALRPIFYWLHHPIPARYAKDFFSRVHDLVYKSAFRGGHHGLHEGFDHLIRVLANDPTLTEPYGMAKMSIAFDAFMEYFMYMGIREFRARPDGYHNYELINILLSSFEDITSSATGINSEETRWLRLITALLQYLNEVVSSSVVQDVSEGIMREFQAFLTPFCEDQLGVQLPDVLDKLDIREIRAYCEYLEK